MGDFTANADDSLHGHSSDDVVVVLFRVTKIPPRKRYVVYWPVTSYDDYGDPVLGDPEVLRARWDDVIEEFLDEDGETQSSNAILYPNRNVRQGAYVWLSRLRGTQTTAAVLEHCPDNPREDKSAWPIRRVVRTPDFGDKRTLVAAII